MTALGSSLERRFPDSSRSKNQAWQALPGHDLTAIDPSRVCNAAFVALTVIQLPSFEYQPKRRCGISGPIPKVSEFFVVNPNFILFVGFQFYGQYIFGTSRSATRLKHPVSTCASHWCGATEGTARGVGSVSSPTQFRKTGVYTLPPLV